MPRTLVVLRHAKAEAFAASDRERALTDRGMRDAAVVGSLLALEGVVPDHVIVSPAVRTRQTWEQVAAATGLAVPPVLDEALYGGGVDAVLEVLRVAPSDAATVLYVGHNPTAQQLVATVDDGQGDAEATTEALSEYPTAAVAVIDVHGPWAELAAGGGSVRAYFVGRA